MPYLRLPCEHEQYWKRGTLKNSKCNICERHYCILESGEIKMEENQPDVRKSCKFFMLVILGGIFVILACIVAPIYSLIIFIKTGKNANISGKGFYTLGTVFGIIDLVMIPIVILIVYRLKNIEIQRRIDDEEALLNNVN